MTGVRIVGAAVLVALAPVLGMDQRPVPLCFFVSDRAAFITSEGVDEALYDAVRDLPTATTALVIDFNRGGFELPAVKIAEILRARRMEVDVVNECDSACTTILQGATTRIAARTAIFGIHAAQPGPHGNDHIDEERRYDAGRMVEWGLDSSLAARYIAQDRGEIFLTAEEAKAVGLVTEVVSDGR